MNDELIKRIDAWFDFRKPKSATGDVINHDCPRDEFAAELLQDCRAALAKKYVPMTDDEFKDWYAKEHEDSGVISIWFFYERALEAEIIRRAGLEVAND